MRIKTLLFLLATTCIYFNAHSQTLDKKFMTTDGSVYVTLQNGDSVYLGGSFNGVGYSVNKLGRFKKGSTVPDLDFPQLGYNDEVSTMAADENGGFYIAGIFSMFNGQSVSNTSILHILSDGKLDKQFGSVYTNGNNIKCLKLKDNRLYVGGSFYYVNGNYSNPIIALNAITGTIENWNPGAVGGSVLQIATSDSLVFIAGYLHLNGESLPGGLIACSSTTGKIIEGLPTTNYSTTTVAINDNTLYIGGDFNNLGYSKKGIGQIALGTSNIDLNFAAVNGNVNCVLPDNNGGYYLGGLFNKAGNVPLTNLAHILPNGNVDTRFIVNINGEVYSLSQDSTNLYIGGSFSIINGASRNNAAAVLKKSGDLTKFNPNTNGPVFTIVNKNSIVYLGGSFTSAKGQLRYYAAACSNSNTLKAWAPNTNSSVNCIIVNNEGTSAFLGGDFTTVKGKNIPYLAKTNTTNGNPFEWKTYPDNTVNSMIINQGVLYIKGKFENINGYIRTQLAAIDTISTTPTPFSVDMWDYSYQNRGLNQLYIDNNKLYVAGNFEHIQNKPFKNIARIDITSGELDSWNENQILSTNKSVYAIAVSGSNLVFGGDFNSIGIQRNHLAAINLDTKSYTIKNWQANVKNFDEWALINYILPYKHDVFICGNFFYDTTSANASPVYMQNLMALNDSTGKISHQFDYKPDNDVTSLCINNNRLIIAGYFSTFYKLNNSSVVKYRSNLAAYNLSDYKLSSVEYNPNSSTYAVSDIKDNLIVSGYFNMLNYSRRDALACFNTKTGMVTSWNPKIGGAMISSLAIKDSVLFAGGYFETVNNEVHNNLVALNLKNNNTIKEWNANVDAGVNSLAIKDNTLYLSGNFEYINNIHRPYAAAVSTNNGTLTKWNPQPNNVVQTILPSGNWIYLGGYFTYLKNNQHQFLGRVSTTTGNPGTWNPSPSSEVSKIIGANKNIYISGDFVNIFGKSRNAIAVLDSATSALKPFDAKVNSYGGVLTMAADGNNLYVGGDYNFYSIGDSSRGSLAGTDITTGQALPFNPRPNVSFGNNNGLSIGKGKLFVGGNWNYFGNHTAPANFAVFTLEPQQQTLNLAFSNVNTTLATISFTKGDGEKRLVVMRDAATPIAPVDGKSYTANPVFKSGGATGNSSFVVYDGDSTCVNVSNLLPGHTYTVSVYEHNGTSTACDYFTDSALTGSFSTPLTVAAANKNTNAIKASLITGAKLYPNPATDYCNIVFEAKTKALYTITLTDEKGGFVQSASLNTVKGSNTFHMNVSAIAAGTYIIVIKDSDGKNETLKFIKN